MHVQLRHAHGPLHPQPVPKRVVGAGLRCIEKGAAARKKAEQVSKESEVSKEEASEEEAHKARKDEKKTNSVETIVDEFSIIQFTTVMLVKLQLMNILSQPNSTST